MNRFSYRLSSLASIGASRLRGFFCLLTLLFLFGSAAYAQGYHLTLSNVNIDNGTLEVYMENDTPVAGFQFNLSGVSITGVSGGSSEANGFTASSDPNTILGFSLTGSTIPSGEATLVEIAFTGTPNEICITNEVLSDSDGNAIEGTVGYCYGESCTDNFDCSSSGWCNECYICGNDTSSCTGCTDPIATNYNSEAVINGGCEYLGDYSLSFDGVDDYVTIEDSDDWAFGSGDFAIQFWAKFDEYTSIYRPLVGQISNGGWSRNLITQGPNGYVDFVEGDNILIYTFTQGNYRLVMTEFSPEFDQWYHLTITRNNGTFQWFINGESVQTHFIIGSGGLEYTEVDTYYPEEIDNISASLEFGRNVEYSRHFDGDLDEIAIFKHGLDAEDILSNILVGVDLEDDELMGYWNLDNPPGVEVLDLSGNEHNGDINGAEWDTDVPIAGCSDESASNYLEGSNTDINCLYNVGPDWYVAVDGDDTYNNGSEEFPYATIQKAVDQAQTLGNEDVLQTIYISPGTYVENISIDLSYDERDISFIGLGEGPESTIIDGNASGSVFYINNFNSGNETFSSFSNLTITNGLSAQGGGIRSRSVDLYLDTVHILDNHLIDQNGSGTEEGGGIYTEYSNFFMIDCVVSGNGGPGAYNTGGGLHLTNADNITIDGCSINDNQGRTASALYIHGYDDVPYSIRNTEFTGNSTEVYGSSVIRSDSYYAHLEMENVVIRDNFVRDYGYAIFALSSGTFSNVTIANNIDSAFGTQARGGISLQPSYGERASEIINCTFSNTGIGVHFSTPSPDALPAIIKNSIFHESDYENISLHWGCSGCLQVEVSYCLFEGGEENIFQTDEESVIIWGEGNFDEDPQFVDAGNGDFTLESTSPCIDAGDPSDLDPDGTRADVGAHYFYQEYQGPNWYVEVSGDDSSGNGSQVSPFASIAMALQSSSDGDAVYVGAGTYVEQFVIPHDISLIGEGSESTIISGGSPSEAQTSLIEFAANPGELDGDVFIQGFTLRDNWAWNGGGINVSALGSNLILEDLLITNNIANNGGGGILLYSSPSVTMTDVTLSGNIGGRAGGGISINNTELTMTDCTIEGNETNNGYAGSQQGGAGIYGEENFWASITLTNVNIDNNIINDSSTSGLGAGIYLNANQTLIMNGGSISGNTAQYGLGASAIYSSGGDIYLDGVTVNDNINNHTIILDAGLTFEASNTEFTGNSFGDVINITAGSTCSVTLDHVQMYNNDTGAGQTILLTGSSNGTISYSRITDNGKYGIFLKEESHLDISHSTISNNIYNTNTGGGIYLMQASTLNVENSILYSSAYGDDFNGADILFSDGYNPNTATIFYSDVGSIQTNDNGTASFGAGYISLDPQFVDADNGDYSLMASSPCVNSGNPESTDEDGTIGDMGYLPYVNDYSGPDWYVSETSGSDLDGTGSSESPFASITAALSFSSDEDIIHVSSGTYVEQFVIPHDISLIGEGSESTIISGGSPSEAQTSLIDFAANPGELDGDVLIQGFTLRDNWAWNGGGINVPSLGSNLILEDLLITNNTANNGGGGILLYSSPSITMTDVTLSGNIAGKAGGGIKLYNTELTMTDCTIEGNETNNGYEGSQQGGAGIFAEENSWASITLTNVNIDNNIINDSSTSGLGGGIRLNNNQTLIMNGGSISGNTAQYGLGASAIYSQGGDIYLDGVAINDNINNHTIILDAGLTFEASNTEFIGNNFGDVINITPGSTCSVTLDHVQMYNNDTGGGEAILLTGSSNGTISYSRITDNGKYGIHLKEESSLELSHSTISNNRSSNAGGGIFMQQASTLNVENSILYSSIYLGDDFDGADIVFSDGYSPNIATVSYSDVGSIQTNDNGTVNFEAGYISLDPQFVDADNGDYNLSENSHCIDTGTADLDGDGVEDDIEYNGLAPDMGAFESEYTAIVGCMDPLGVNYSPDAWISDECSYEGGNYSLSFDGVNDYVEIQNSSFRNDLAGTLIFWVNLQDEGPHYIFNGGHTNGLGVSIGAAGVGVQQLWVTSSPAQSFNVGTIDLNTWHHLAIVSHGTGNPYDVYLNGVIANAETPNGDGFIEGHWFGLPGNNGETIIGNIDDGVGNQYDMYTNGNLDDIQVWNYPLPQEEIQSNILANITGEEAYLAAYWSFNDAPGDVLTDASGNNNHGNIIGAEWSNESVVIGCMDEGATNYNPDANVDSGCSSYEGPNWYVSTSGDDVNGDGSLESSFSSIQHGIDLSSDGDTVLVSVGTYVENIDFIGKSIVVQGENKETTIIDGNQNGSVVKLTNNETSDAVLKNFTIQNGNGSSHSAGGETTYGGGIYIFSSNPVLENLIIQNNSANWGGGLEVEISASVLRNLTIRNNHSSYAGGGLSVAGVQEGMKIDHTIIYGNTTTSFGGGVHIYNMQDAIPQFSNVTISNNTSNGQGGGVYSYFHGHSSFLNSIISNNSPQEICFPDYAETSSMSVSYSNIEGGQESIVTNDNATITWGDGNIDVDSRFIDEENDDYHLLASSQCINSGHPDFTDSDGTRPDIGGLPYLNNYDGGVDLTWYVSNDNGSDITGTGENINPFSSVQAGLNFVRTDQSVNVESGTYIENIIWPETSSVTLQGSDRETTIIDGGGIGSVITMSNSVENASVSGFTITNGQYEEDINSPYYQLAGGINIGTTYEAETTAVLSDLHITNNAGYSGGGILSQPQSFLDLSNSVIDQNTAATGGGMQLAGGFIIDSVDIINNIGYGIYFYYAQGQISNSRISNNVMGMFIVGANYDGDLESPGIIFDHVEIIDNVGGQYPEQIGIGSNTAGSSQNNVLFNHVTIALTDPDAYDYSAIRTQTGGLPSHPPVNITLRNSIIGQHSGGAILHLTPEEPGEVDVFVEYSNIAGGEAAIIDANGAACCLNIYENSIDVDSRFVDSENGDFHLLASSFCINSGHPDSTDADGTRADMGALPYLNNYDGGIDSNWWVSNDDGNDITGTGEYTNPFASVQAGLNFANDNDTVLVASGTYNENVIWPNSYTYDKVGIQLIGDNRETTIIDGGASGSVMHVEWVDSTSYMSGFTLQNGLAEYGGGLHLSSSEMTFENLIITGNHATSWGGGMYVTGVAGGNGWAPHMNDIIFSNNNSDSHGDVAFLNAFSTTIITNSIIEDHTITSNHNFIACSQYGNLELDNVIIRNNYLVGYLISTYQITNVNIKNSQIINNVNTQGAGNLIYMHDYVSVNIENTLIADNEAGAIHQATSDSFDAHLSLNEVTMTGNMSSDGTASGIKITSSSSGTGGYTNISNSIIYDNGDSLQIFVDDDIGHILNIEYSNIQNGSDLIVEADSINWNDGNIDVDPRFVSVIEGEEDYHLLASSLCINAGHPDSTDSDGTQLDMGAYPYLNDYDGGIDSNWWVSTADGSDITGTGENFSPFASVQAGLNFAHDNGTVIVSNGLYQENVIWPDYTKKMGVNLIGNDMHNTIIDGGGIGTVMEIDWVDTTSYMSGFTLQNGFSDNNEKASGLHISESEMPIDDIILQWNDGITFKIAQSSAWGAMEGGDSGWNSHYDNWIVRDNLYSQTHFGIYSFANVNMSNSLFTNNQVYDGVISSTDYTSLVLNNSVMSYNTGDYRSAIYFYRGSYLEINDCQFTNNQGSSYVIDGANYSTNIIRNTLISNNIGAGIRTGPAWNNENGNIFENLTITNNTGPGITIRTSSNIINSSIITGNGEGPHEQIVPFYGETDPIDLEIIYSNVSIEESTIDSVEHINLTWGDGNINVDPSFVNEGEQNYNLLASSLCINSGHPDSTDSDGTRTDMGAYSYLTDNNGSDWYVETSGSDVTGSGTSENPFASVQAGLNFAINDNNSVYVAAGTYYENVEWVIENLGLQLIGDDQATTIIDGGGTGSALSIDSTIPYAEEIDTQVSGFTLTNGFSDYGGGLNLYRSSANFSDMTITGNTAEFGAGISIVGAANGQGGPDYPTLDNIVVANNSSNFLGGGIYTSYNIFPTISNAIIENNDASGTAGGIYTHHYHNVTYNNCIIRNNEAGLSGGIYAEGMHTSSITMNDCEIIDNTSTSTADNNSGVVIANIFHLKNVLIAGNDRRIYLSPYAPSTLENVTITNNGDGVHVGDGLDPNYNPGININNTIIAHNGPNPFELNSQLISDPQSGNDVDIFVENSLINGLWGSPGSAGFENLLFTFGSYQAYPLQHFEDPLFTDPEAGDYTLAWESPCINTGDIDLDGDGTDCITDSDDQNADGTCQDMGAYQTNLFEIAERTGGARINEIMINPSVLDYEFFELHNNSDQAVWLHEWSFNVNGIASHTIDDVNLILGVNEYKILSRSPNTCANCGGTDYSYTAMPPFNNSQGTLSIYNVNDGQEDILSYNNTDFNIIQNTSLEIFVPDGIEEDAYWVPSSNHMGYELDSDMGDLMYGTPRAENSTVYSKPTANAGEPYFDTDINDDGSEMIVLDGSGSYDYDAGVIVEYLWSYDGGDVISQTDQSSASALIDVGLHSVVLKVTDNSGLYHTDTTSVRVYPRVPMIAINELMIETSEYGILNDEGEYIELINLDDEDVDISGWTLSFENQEIDHIISPDESLIVPAQGFIVLGRSADWYWSYGVAPDYVYGDIELDNLEESITLTTPLDQVVDEVSYESWWSAVSGSTGSAMERLSALQSGSDSENWENSTSDSFNFYGLTGTPGEENSIEIPTGDPYINEYSLSFDGENDYVDCGNISDTNFGSNDFTVSWWEHRTVAGELDVAHPAAVVRDHTAEFPPFIFGQSIGSNIYICIANEELNDWEVCGFSFGEEDVTLNEWTHYSVARNANQLLLYKNSELVNSMEFTASIPISDGSIGIGKQLDHYFPGMVDEVQIWNRALTGNEIQEKMYQQLIPNYEEGLAAYYQFDEGSGLTTYDIAGGYNGEINGAEYSDELPPNSAEIWGCTDESAYNYYPGANEDDGSCLYPPENLVASGDSNPDENAIYLSWDSNECDETSSRGSDFISREITSINDFSNKTQTSKISKEVHSTQNQEESIARSRDCESYDIYYSPEGSGSFELLASGVQQTTYVHGEGLGYLEGNCYQVIAVHDGFTSTGSNIDCARTSDCDGNTAGYDDFDSDNYSDFDDCGVCDGENSNMDCAGVCFGNSTYDSCGVCDNIPSNNNYTCTACTDESALNYGLNCDGESIEDPAIDDGCCEYPAQTYYVDIDVAEGGDGSEENPFSSLDSALDASSEGDIIRVLPGVYPGDITLPHNLQILSVAGRDYTTITGQGMSRVFSFGDGINSSTVVDGFTLIDGFDLSKGGAMLIENASPVLRNLDIRGNQAPKGGAVYIENSSSVFESVSLTGNYTSDFNGKGGALYIESSTVELDFVTVSGNFALDGGGAYITGGGNEIDVSNSVFWNNENEELKFYNVDDGSGFSQYQISFSLIDAGQSSITHNGWVNSAVYDGSNLSEYDSGDMSDEDIFINPIAPSTSSAVSEGNYHLHPASPCIGAAQDSSDMGAYPFEPIVGCMDESACNYDPLASIDCGDDCCEYVCFSTYYVNGNSSFTDDANGSQANPFTTVQNGLDWANPGDTIYIAPAVYSENIVITKSIKLYSYFKLHPGDESYIEQTEIDCAPGEDNERISCITVASYDFQDEGAGLPEIVGFTIKNGTGTLITYDDSGESYYVGGGIFIDHSFPIVQHNRFIDNGSYTEDVIDAGGAIYGFYGGGISYEDIPDVPLDDFSFISPMVLSYNMFENNFASYGKTITVIGYEGEIDMSNCEFDVFDSETNGRNGNVSSYWCAKNQWGAWWNYSNGTGREAAITSDVWIDPEGGTDDESGDEDSPLGSLTYALSHVFPGSDGESRTINLVNYRDVRLRDREYPLQMVDHINIKGQGVGETDITGNTTKPVLSFDNTVDTEIRDMTIKDGGGRVGGGIKIYESSPVLKFVEISENASAEKGGGLYVESSSPVLENVEVRNNESIIGAGIYFKSSDVTIRNTEIKDNELATSNEYERKGGGIYSLNTNLTIENMVISGNIATGGRGGGIMVETTSENGRIDAHNDFDGVQMSNNIASEGAGMYFSSNSMNTLSNVLISDNVAFNEGGGIYTEEGSYSLIINSTIVNNNAWNDGAGLYVQDVDEGPVIVNSIIWGNTLGEGEQSGVEQISFDLDSDVHLYIIHSNIEGAYNSELGEWFTIEEGFEEDQVNFLEPDFSLTNLDIDPLFSDPLNGDYSLSFNSPCINTATQSVSFTNTGVLNAYLEISEEFDPLVSIDTFEGCAPDMGYIEFSGESDASDCVCDGESCLGCTDELANNYNENAIMDDGSCTYDSQTPEEFSFNQSSLQAFYFVIEATIEGEPIEVGEDYLAVFNGDICVGSEVWIGPFTEIGAMGDDGEDYTEGYLNVGDVPTFKIYDTSGEEFYDAIPSLTTEFGGAEDLAFSINEFYYLENLNGVETMFVTYDIPLHYGANLVSFHALPEDISIGNVMSSLGEAVTGVIGEGQAASPNPVLGWVGSLSEIQRTSGYWIKTNDDVVMQLTQSIPSDLDLVYDLHYGANLISFPSPGSVPLADALPDDIELFVTGIIGEGQAASPNPVLGWVGSLTAFEGTRGYWVKTDSDFSFSFDISGASIRETANNSDSPYLYYQSMNQVFYFAEDIDDSGLGLELGDWILTYHGSVLVGARQWSGAFTDLPAMGYDGTQSTAGYCMTDVAPTFKWVHSSGEIFDLYGDIPEWSLNEIYYITLSADDSHLPDTFDLGQNYPNPFNGSTTIPFSVHKKMRVSISIYDVSGKYINEIFSKDLERGHHSVTWNALDMNGNTIPSGFYIYQISGDGITLRNKMILMK